MAEVPANVAAARQQAITTDYYALGYLALCTAAYSDESGTPGAIEAAVAANVPQIGQIGDVPGKWTLDWGPAITTNRGSWKANLLFAGSYRDPESDLPIFSAVVIRGTDTSAGFRGVVTQVKEDLEAGCQLVWPSGAGACAHAEQSASDVPYIARGTLKGFRDLIGLQGANQSTQEVQTVAQFLTEFLPVYADSAAPLPLIVTGHSLGGCQTSPLALYVYQQVSALDFTGGASAQGVTVVPNSFAAPTAGNQAFVNAYMSAMPDARRWFNTFDLVPKAFDDVKTMRDLWGVAPYSCGSPIPDLARPLLDLFEFEVAHLQYAHEGGTANRQLDGACRPESDWGKQLEFQHFPLTGYWNLMINQYSSVLGALPVPAWAPPMYAGV